MPTRRLVVALLMLTLAASGPGSIPAADPPTPEQGGEVTPTRVSYLYGDVSFWRPGAQEWAEATANTPLAPGDVLATNDPFCGGSHLPDVTVVTPVFVAASGPPAFFVGSRGHQVRGELQPGKWAARGDRARTEYLFEGLPQMMRLRDNAAHTCRSRSKY